MRVDGTVISDTSGRMAEGIDNKSVKLAIKYSTPFDGMLPCEVNLFCEPIYGSGDMALPRVITSHLKQQAEHCNIYIVDWGLQSTRNMKSFSDESVCFIACSKEKRKFVELEDLLSKDTDLGELTMIKDSKVYLYTGQPINNKQGNKHDRQELVEDPFRLIVARSKTEPDSRYWFITNDFEPPAKEITDAYRKRWDIEVFSASLNRS